MVDVQTVAQQRTLTNELLDAVPTAGRLPQSFVVFIPGVVTAAAGAGGQGGFGNNSNALAIHGSRSTESNVAIDGMGTRNISGVGGGNFWYYVNEGIVQEVVVSTGGIGAEQQMSGIVTNVIPKEGSNRFTGSIFFTYGNEHLQSNNISDELRSAGPQLQWHQRAVGLQPVVRWTPQSKQALVFFVVPRLGRRSVHFRVLLPAGADELDLYARQDATGSQQGERQELQHAAHLAGVAEEQVSGVRRRAATLHLESQCARQRAARGHDLYASAADEFPSARLEIAAELQSSAGGGLGVPGRQTQSAAPVRPATGSDDHRRDGVDNRFPDSRVAELQHDDEQERQVSCLAGIVHHWHARIQGGLRFHRGIQEQVITRNGDYTVTLRNGSPTQMTLFAPVNFRDHLDADLGVFAQDQWTVRRASLNFGIRYDYLNASVLAADVPANRWLPAHHFDRCKRRAAVA